MIGSNTRDYQQDTRREAVSPQHVHVLEAERPAGVDGHLQRADPRNLHRPPRADQHAAAGAGDAQRPAVRRGGPAPGRSDASRTAARPPTTALDFIARAAAGPAASGRGAQGGPARRSTTCSAYYKAHPDDATKLIAVGESKADPALDAADAGRLDDAGQRADEPGRSAEQVDANGQRRDRPCQDQCRMQITHARTAEAEDDHEPVPRIRPLRDAPAVLRPGLECRRLGGAGLAAGRRRPGAAADDRPPTRPRPDCTSPPRPSRSSICTWSAARRRWTSTTTSRR